MNGTQYIEVELELPAFIPEDEARRMLAVKLYEKGRLSLGQAARTAAYSKRAFIDLLGLEGVSVLNSAPSELAAETDW